MYLNLQILRSFYYWTRVPIVLLFSRKEKCIIQSTLHNSDRFYPDFCIFRTELLSPINFLLKCNTEKVST